MDDGPPRTPGDVQRLNIDDVEIWAFGAMSAVGERSSPRAASDSSACPNPFSPIRRFRYALAEAGEVRLTVFDVAGRHVAALLEGQPSRPARTASPGTEENQAGPAGLLGRLLRSPGDRERRD